MANSRKRVGKENGIALVACLLAITLLLALSATLLLTTSAETMIAGNFRNSLEGDYAAAAGLELAVGDLLGVPSWNPLLAGSLRSGFVDGPASGPRTLPDGTTINLTQIANIANCSRITSCTESQMDAVTAERPWGSNNPRWQLYAHGPLHDMLHAGRIESAYYVVVLVADDQGEADGNPSVDGVVEGGPGTGVIALRGESFGARNTHHGVEATVARSSGALRVLSWRNLSHLDRP